MRSASPGTNLALRLDEYTVARRARVDRVARASRRLGLLYQAQGRLAVKARDAALSRLSPRLLTRAAAPHHWTPPT
jgi:2-polyprenyl-6-methoxyphenol hydroxylase-like FAD-dependent oxidoreductase